MATKRKKVIGMRGSKTHGYGSKKKHRGGGSKGGKGRAGSKKHMKLFIKRRGLQKRKVRFKSLEHKGIRTKEKAINLGDLVKLTDKSEIDAKEFGYGKVLSGGALDRPVTIKAKAFSEKAKEKIEAAGGQAVVEE